MRTIFGDGAAATLIEAADEPSLGSFVFGTDGRGADTLMVAEGGARPPDDGLQPRKRKRWPSSLVMDGPEIVKFTPGRRAADDRAGAGQPPAGPATTSSST